MKSELEAIVSGSRKCPWMSACPRWQNNGCSCPLVEVLYADFPRTYELVQKRLYERRFVRR